MKTRAQRFRDGPDLRARRLCNLGGGGSSGATTNTVSEFKPPSYTQQGWQDYVTGAGALTAMPYTQYAGMRQAPVNATQNQAMDLTSQRALYGAPDLNAARGQVADTASGAYLGFNPYVGNQYTQAVIGDNANNMARAYAMGTGAQTDAAFGRGGAYGGSAYNQMQAANAAGLANSVGQMANQYQLQNAALGSADWQNERANMMQASGLAGQLSQDDWTAAKALSGIGDFQQAQTQGLLNQGVDEFNRQTNWPQQMLDLYGSALTRASGGSVMGTSNVSQTQPGMSGLGAALGLGAIGYGLLGS